MFVPQQNVTGEARRWYRAIVEAIGDDHYATARFTEGPMADGRRRSAYCANLRTDLDALAPFL